MSIVSDCRSSAQTLLEDPNLNPYGIERVFTELDVIFLAAKDAGGYSPDEMRVAQRDASQVMGELFRARQVTRYGPVSLEALGLDHQDYARIASKIIYAHPEGPDQLVTPNGTFPRMMWEQDIIKRPGRRLGANRSDLEPWAAQDILRITPVERSTKPSSAAQRENLRLTAENEALHQRLTQVEAENFRLRDQLTSDPLRAELQGLIDSLEDRVINLENRDH